MTAKTNKKAISYIRWSSGAQTTGDSLRRQFEATKKYCAEHGLSLDETVRDEGVSAFKGRHRKAGLGRLLEAIDAGRIEPGTTLIIESLDRLSREEVTESLELFLSIMRRGIRIVTLLDGKCYSRENTKENFTDLIVSIVLLARAHEESTTKSKRIKAAWATKQTAAKSGKLLTKTGPSWLRWDDQKLCWQQIPERVAVIRRIFKWYAEGMNKLKICQRLNAESVPTWKGQGGGWHPSVVVRLTGSKAAIGHLEMGKRNAEGRREISEVIEGYYPAVIDRELFDRCQARRKVAVPGRGAAGEVNNLFPRIIRDGYHPEARVDFVNKASVMRWRSKATGEMVKKPAAGSKFYFVSDARRLNPAHQCRWNYVKFEKIFLHWAIELDWRKILSVGRDDTSTTTTKRTAGLRTKQRELETQIGRLVDLAADGKLKAAAKKLSALETELEQIETELRSLEATTSERRAVRGASIRDHDAFLKLLQSRDQTQRQALRAAIAERVEKVELFPQGLPGGLKAPEVTGGAGWPAFRVTFISGAERVVLVDEDRENIVAVFGDV